MTCLKNWNNSRKKTVIVFQQVSKFKVYACTVSYLSVVSKNADCSHTSHHVSFNADHWLNWDSGLTKYAQNSRNFDQNSHHSWQPNEFRVSTPLFSFYTQAYSACHPLAHSQSIRASRHTRSSAPLHSPNQVADSWLHGFGKPRTPLSYQQRELAEILLCVVANLKLLASPVAAAAAMMYIFHSTRARTI